MTEPLFMRKATLKVGTLDVSDFRFGFNVERDRRQAPNKATISVWNLSPDKRKTLESSEDGIPVELIAGYESGTSTLLLAELDTAVSERADTDWITTIKSEDGKSAAKKRSGRGFRGGVSVNKVLKDLADDMGIGLGNLTTILSKSLSIDEIGSSFAGGFSSKGGSADAFFQLLESTGHTASIQNGELQVVRKGVAATAIAVFLSKGSGLIGNPMVDSKGRIEVTSLLSKDLVPGALIDVDSTTAKGQWVIDTVEYVGDTFRKEWYAEMEGAPL